MNMQNLRFIIFPILAGKEREQIPTGTQQKELQLQGAEPPEFFHADDHRRRRNQTSNQLDEGGPPTL